MIFFRAAADLNGFQFCPRGDTYNKTTTLYNKKIAVDIYAMSIGSTTAKHYLDSNVTHTLLPFNSETNQM